LWLLHGILLYTGSHGEDIFLGQWEQRDPTQSIIGICNYFTETKGGANYIIDRLPYASPDDQFIVHAVNSQGTLVVSTDNQTVLIAPQQSWEQRSTYHENESCHITYTHRLFNYSLLSEGQIHGSRP
jgi:hypothetical protein